MRLVAAGLGPWALGLWSLLNFAFKIDVDAPDTVTQDQRPKAKGQRQAVARLTLLALTFLLSSLVVSARTLDIYFIDVEGGAATLIVTPLGESILVDSGYPGDRDAGRIAQVARDVAHLKQIDHYITTHWHRDHVGGVARLVELIPVKRYYDHGLPQTPSIDVFPILIDAYKKTSEGKRETLKPGDQIKLRNARSTPRLRLEVLASRGIVKGEQPGAPQIHLCNPEFKVMPEDKTDNANSIAFVLDFGTFRFFDGGDLTWNVENKIVCPRDLVGAVDVYQVDHHGFDISNHPALVKILNPRVAIINNGARKAGDAKTFAMLKGLPEIEGVFQLHRNVLTTESDNAPADYIANEEENCKGEFIKLSVAGDGRSYAVSIPSKQIIRRYRVRKLSRKS